MNFPAELRQWAEKHAEMLALAKVTVGLLEKVELDALDDNWERRRKVFKEITNRHKRLLPHFQAWEETLARLNPEQAGEAARLVEGVKVSAREVKELDDYSEAMMTNLRDKLNRNIKQVKDGQKLMHAYRPVPKAGMMASKLSKSG